MELLEKIQTLYGVYLHYTSEGGGGRGYWSYRPLISIKYQFFRRIIWSYKEEYPNSTTTWIKHFLDRPILDFCKG